MADQPSVFLDVGGKRYGGWTSIQITLSIEAIAGAYLLGTTDRWNGQDEEWPIADGEECTVRIGDQVVLTGYVDERRLSYRGDQRGISIAGRDKAGDLVDCSVITKNWEMSNRTVEQIVRDIAAPFGIPVRMAPGVAVPKAFPKFSIDPGDTAFEAITRAAQKAALLPVSDGRGGLVLTRTGNTRAVSALVEGENILVGDASYSQRDRFARYVVAATQSGSDETSGAAAASVMAEATDGNVRPGRVLMLRVDGNHTIADAKRLAAWHAAVRAGKAALIDLTAQGWTQADGSIWPLNAIVPVRSPMLGIDADMLISEVTYAIDNAGGTHTLMRVTRPDAYLPEPVTDDESALSSSRHWKIADGEDGEK